MNNKNLEINGLFVAGIILIISFVYTINTQPFVFGTDTTTFLSDNDNHNCDLMSFKSYEDFSQTDIQFQDVNEPDIVKKDEMFNIEHSLFINEVLLCRISNKLIKMNNLVDLSEINSIKLK